MNKEEMSSDEEEFNNGMVTESDMEQIEILGEGEEEGVDDEAEALDPTVARQDDSLCAFEGHSDSVYAVDVRFFGEQAVAASGGGDEQCYLWDAATGKSLFHLSGHKDSISSVKFNGDGSLLASASLDGSVKVWQSASGNLLGTLEGPTEGINWLTWHPKGNVILAGAQDASCWMWGSNGTFMNAFYGHSKSVVSGLFTSDGKNVVTGSEDGTVRVWDPKGNAENSCLQIFQGPGFHEADVLSLASQVQNSSLLMTGSHDTTAKVVNIHNGKVLATLKGHEDSVEAVAFSSNQPFGVTGSLDKKVIVWDLNTLQVRSTSLHNGGVISLTWHPEQPHILISASLDKTVRVWDIRTGNCEKVLKGHMNGILSLAVSSNGKAIVTGSDDQSALVYVL